MVMALPNIFFVITVLTTIVTISNCKSVDPGKCIAYGPAFNVDLVTPVRYFFIQAVDKKGKNFTHTPGKDTFKINLPGVRAYRDVLDRRDGSFIVRYHLMNTERDYKVEVTTGGKHIKGSPFTMKGWSYHEQCDCPCQDAADFKETYSCSDTYSQLEADFEKFPKIDLVQVREKAKTITQAMVHYTIKNNRVYRKKLGTITDFTSFSDEWFLSLARKVIIPDVEFLFNLGDWPKQFNHVTDPPIMSWCGSNDTHDIIIPTYDLTKSSLHDMTRDTNTMSNVQGHSGPKWKAKKAKALFRGRDSRRERLDLIDISKKRPELFNVGLTRFFFFKKEEHKYEKAQYVSFLEHFEYKYQINIDGTVAAYRFPYLLMGGSLVFKQESKYYEHFYKELTPWEHYVPIKSDLSDLIERIEWAKKNDKEAGRIARSGQQYARDNLMADKLYCYTLAVLKAYSDRQINEPIVAPDMEHQKQPSDDKSKCNCNRKKGSKKKKKKKKSISKKGKEEL